MGRYCPHSTWVETLAHRERALAKRHACDHEKWSMYTRSLPDLHVGDQVYIKDLVGTHRRRCERTGTVVEVKQFHQYVVKIDGSGHLKLRNRQCLRRFTPLNTQPQEEESLSPAMLAEQPNGPQHVLHPTASRNQPMMEHLPLPVFLPLKSYVHLSAPPLKN